MMPKESKAVLDILVVGGSRFVGRHITEAAVAAGHSVALANRGQTSTDTFGAEVLHRIDREVGDLESVRGTSFDAVIDVSAYVPRAIADLAEALGDVGRYVFISTVSTYASRGLTASHDEHGDLKAPAQSGDPSELYGELKVACEDVAREVFDGRATVLRPGVVAGPHDPTDRFTWWTRHLAEDDRLDLPDHRGADDSRAHVQVIDARDLARFCIELAEGDVAGTFDVAGVPHRLEDFVEQVREGVAGTAEIRWTPDWAADAHPPLVLHADWHQDGIFSRTSEAAVRAGLVRRPLPETARDTRAWDLERGLPDLKV